MLDRDLLHYKRCSERQTWKYRAMSLLAFKHTTLATRQSPPASALSRPPLRNYDTYECVAFHCLSIF